MAHLPVTEEGLVTGLAIARAVRSCSRDTLATRVFVKTVDITAWERGAATPTGAQLRRLGLALRWPMANLQVQPVDLDEAAALVSGAKQRIHRSAELETAPG